MSKVNKKTGEVTYYHQLLGAAIVHPDLKEVVPLCPEPIHKQDGVAKNDCERNAAKRLLPKIRADHPRLKIVVVEDGLASNAPHVRDLMANDMRYLLGAKPGDHAFLFARFLESFEAGRVVTATRAGGTRKASVQREISFANGLPLNESNQDLLVNLLQYREFDADANVVLEFSWITDLTITRKNAWEMVRGGRARWKIENETFNTLKNQGYHFEHNFGHGNQHLSTVFATLMMLAFLIDQVQQLGCPLFQAALARFKSKRTLWDRLRSAFNTLNFTSMRHVWEFILCDLGKRATNFAPTFDTS